MPELPDRKRIMIAFYRNGEIWKTNRHEVNSWIVDSDNDNVLLVKPVSDLITPATENSVVALSTKAH